MVSADLFFVLFGSSSLLLTCCWVFILRQFCCASISNQKQIQRTAFAFLFCSCALFMNTMYYLSSLYPHYIIFSKFSATDLRNICEVLMVIIGSHTYKVYLSSLYDQLYAPIRNKQPKCIRYSPLIIQFLVIIAAIFCYICLYIYNNDLYLYLFYIILDGVILIVWIIFCYIWTKVWAFTRVIDLNNHSNNIKAKQLIRLVKGTMCVAIIIGISDIIVIFISLDFIYDFTPLSYNEVLMGNIVYSAFLIMISIPLIIWAYKKTQCCIMDEDSVCALCECGLFSICCKKRKKRQGFSDADGNGNLPILLEESSTPYHHNQNHVTRGTKNSGLTVNTSPGNPTIVTVPTDTFGSSFEPVVGR